jgi:type II secretory pathway pseudopilin PulG
MNPSAFGKELITVAVLGLILLAAAGVLTAAVVTSNTDSVSVDLWGVTVTNLTLGVVFVAGMITTVLAVVGLGLLMGGVRRGRRLRQERRALRRENEQLAQRVEAAPPTDQSAVGHDDRPRAVHDDRTQVMHDDRAQVMHDDRAQVMHDDRAQVMHDDRTRVTHDDRTRTDADAPRHTGQAPAGDAPPADEGARRSVVPRQEDRIHTESGPRTG